MVSASRSAWGMPAVDRKVSTRALMTSGTPASSAADRRHLEAVQLDVRGVAVGDQRDQLLGQSLVRQLLVPQPQRVHPGLAGVPGDDLRQRVVRRQHDLVEALLDGHGRLDLVVPQVHLLHGDRDPRLEEQRVDDQRVALLLGGPGGVHRALDDVAGQRQQHPRQGSRHRDTASPDAADHGGLFGSDGRW